MSIFSAIGGKPLKDLQYPRVCEFFVEHVFDQFMENGRHGINQVALDLVHTLAEYCRQRSAQLAKVQLSEADEETITRHARKALMHTLITSGVHEWHNDIGSVYNHIINSLRDTAEGRK